MKTIFSYVVIFALLVLFALFLDAKSGLFIILIFLAAIVISTALHLYAVKSFDCDITASASLLEKGEELVIKLKVPGAKFFLPTVFEIKLMPSFHFESSEDTYHIILGKNAKTKEFSMKARFWGKGAVGVEYIKCRDILGIFASFAHTRAFSPIIEKNVAEVKIYPSVPDLSERSDLVRVLEDASDYDDNEQSREVPGAVTGFPGYEHRDYVPGDPLKSVNWKLSAKRDKLLVRKPEAYAGGDQVFVLDCKQSPKRDVAEARGSEQTAIEAMLSLTRVMTKREIFCRVYVKLGGSWQVFAVDGEDGIEATRFALTEYGFGDFVGRLPDISGEKASGYVVFTASADSELSKLTEIYKQKGIRAEVAASDIADGASGSGWAIEQYHGEILFRRGI